MNANNIEEQFQTIYQDISKQVFDIEYALYIKKTPTEKLIRMLGKLVMQCEEKPFAHFLQFELGGTIELCTRISSIYTRLLTDFTIKFSYLEIFLLTLQKRFISYVFEVSGYYSRDSVLKLLRERAQEKPTKTLTENPALVRAMMLGSITDIAPEDLVELSLEHSETAAMLTMGLLLDRLPVTMTGEASRTYLLEEYNPYSALRPVNEYAALVSNIWMLCSYSASPKKHLIKKHLNDWFCRLHEARGIKPKPFGSVPQPLNTQQKPVMAVVAETFNSLHAMYRWYAPIIKQLKEHYFMVLVALPGDVDEISKALFDRFIEVPADDMNLQPILNACTPDVVYFTSVGMRAWGISMANIRWAPLQVMSFGHPATTYSEHIDLAFINTRTVVDAPVIQENLLVLESEIGSLIEKHRFLKLPEPYALPEDVVNIAVPCNVMKINLSFLTALKEIERLSNKPIRFMFFPNEFGVGHLSTERRLKSFFPNAIVAKRANYDIYLSWLNQNHFALSPFPFGNATSTIDCMVLGLPVIGLLGDEPHSRSDYDVLAAFDLDAQCIPHTLEAYVSTAVHYINNPDDLKKLRQLVASKDFLSRHEVDKNPLSEEFVKALNWAFLNQDKVCKPRGLQFSAQDRWRS